MPPEQMRGERLDVRADLFSVGAVLYEMLQGRRAYPGTTARERVQAILHREPDPLSEQVPEPLRRIVMRSLAKEPADRFGSAREFLAAVREIGRESRGSRPRTLAVLDLDCRGEDETRRWIAGALPDSLAASLGRIEGVAALPRPKVRAAAAEITASASGPLAKGTRAAIDVGLALGCDLVASGSLELAGDKMLARVRLTDVVTGHNLLDESASCDRDELFAFSESYAGAASVALGVKAPSSGAASPDLEAYECYWRGRQLALSAGHARMEEGRELLARAVSIQPDFAPALAQLAFLHAAKFAYTADPEILKRAVEYGRRAVDADPELPEAHLNLGYARGGWRGDLDGIKSIRRAVELDPNNFMGPYFLASGLIYLRDEKQLRSALDCPDATGTDELQSLRRRRAHELAQRSVQINPNFVWGWLNLGWIHVEDGDLTEARWCMEKAAAMEPRAVPPFGGAAGFVAECLRREGSLVEARRMFHEGLDATEKKDHMYRDTMRGLFLCGLGRTALEQEDAEAARAAFTQAVLHVRGRSGMRCGGHALVQALAGLARAVGEPRSFVEAIELFEQRRGFDFTPVWGLFDDIDLLELSRAARSLGRDDEARALLGRSVRLDSLDARREAASD
jgi:tetratricopeptide (TPR) repeat protein